MKVEARTLPNPFDNDEMRFISIIKPPMSFVFKITNLSMEDDFKPNKKNLIPSER